MVSQGKKPIRPHEAEVIKQAMRAGVVPPIGLQHIQVGRVKEIDTMIRDIDRIATGGTAMRFVIGDYGAGKTFFLNVIRRIALEKKLVVMKADMTPNHRLYSANGGQARLLYSELVKNMSTRGRPEGQAMPVIIQKYIADQKYKVLEAGGEEADVEKHVYNELRCLQECVSGFDFVKVICLYTRGIIENDDALQDSAACWLRGEYRTPSQARAELGVSSIINDINYYNFFKLWAKLVVMCGYQGILICLDEAVNLYKLSKKKSRDSNYEKILHMYNDVLQVVYGNIGFVFAGTPQFLYDPRRGLCSYEALETRLMSNTFSKGGYVDMNGPVIKLENLSQEDLFVLLKNIRRVFACGDESKYLVNDDHLYQFMKYCYLRIGEAYFRTPRNTVKAFIEFLSIIEQYPSADISDLLGGIEIDQDNDMAGEDVDSELATFKL